MTVARVMISFSWLMTLAMATIAAWKDSGPVGYVDGWLSWVAWIGWCVALSWLGRRVRTTYDRVRAEAALERIEFGPIGPNVDGPLGVVLVDPDGAETPLAVVPFAQSCNGHTVWLGYGPAGAPIPAWGEIRVRVMPPRCDLLLQTEEDDDGGLRYAARPDSLDLWGNR
jgi:hypothetical protein